MQQYELTDLEFSSSEHVFQHKVKWFTFWRLLPASTLEISRATLSLLRIKKMVYIKNDDVTQRLNLFSRNGPYSRVQYSFEVKKKYQYMSHAVLKER